MPSTDAQKRFGRLPINRTKKLTQAELESGMALEQLRNQQARLKREFQERQRRTKLTPAQVAEIRRRLSLGQRSVDIARDFNLGSGHMAGIRSGRLWPKVKAAMTAEQLREKQMELKAAAMKRFLGQSA